MLFKRLSKGMFGDKFNGAISRDEASYGSMQTDECGDGQSKEACARMSGFVQWKHAWKGKSRGKATSAASSSAFHE
jgi:hypothetical protein